MNELELNEVQAIPEMMELPAEVVDHYVDENGNVQEIVEAYNPDTNFEPEEEVILDTTQYTIYKIDENMPPELKEQIEKFNRRSQNLNSIINGDYDYVPQDLSDDEYTSYEADESDGEATTISEENVVVGNLF